FPVINAAQPANGGAFIDPDFPGTDAFVTEFQTNGTSLVYSTYLGGSGYESGFQADHFGIAVDKWSYIYLTGQTSGADDFPVTVGADRTNSNALTDGFVAKINPAVSGPASLIYSSLLGGDDNVSGGAAENEATSIAVDAGGNFYVAGITSAT